MFELQTYNQWHWLHIYTNKDIILSLRIVYWETLPGLTDFNDCSAAVKWNRLHIFIFRMDNICWIVFFKRILQIVTSYCNYYSVHKKIMQAQSLMWLHLKNQSPPSCAVRRHWPVLHCVPLQSCHAGCLQQKAGSYAALRCPWWNTVCVQWQGYHCAVSANPLV